MQFSGLFVAMSIAMIALQFLDWYSTKIFVKYTSPWAEGNAAAREDFFRAGGSVPIGLLWKKLALSAFAIVLLLLAPSLYDPIVGLSIGAMSLVVLGNFLGILTYRFLVREGKWIAPSSENLPYRTATFAAHSALIAVVLLAWGISAPSAPAVWTSFYTAIFALICIRKNIK